MFKKLITASAIVLSFAVPTIASAYIEEKTVDDLPKNLEWITNDSFKEIGSDKAIKGGVMKYWLQDYPPTFRSVGPNSNSEFRGYINTNRLVLVEQHPNNSSEWIPVMATHWAFGDDGKTVFYKLNPKAKWSDGKPVTADDYTFLFEMMRSEHIVAPWYKNHYTEQLVGIRKYDDHTISIEANVQKPKPDLLYHTTVPPRPKHFHKPKLKDGWVKATNWEIEPNTGPYQVSKFKKGKFVEFKRKKDWWGNDMRYFKNRFNIDFYRLNVIRDQNSAWEQHIKGNIDWFRVPFPKIWNGKAKGEIFDKGHIRRAWIYNDTPQSPAGLFINVKSKPFLNDKKVRYAIAHAVNFDKMNSVVLNNDYSRLPGFSTGLGDYSNTSIKAREFSIEKANKLLDEAGWTERGKDGVRIKDGERLSFSLLYTYDAATPRMALFKEEMAKAGIEMNLNMVKGSAGFKKLLEKQHEVSLSGWSTSFRPGYWQYFHSDNAKPQTNNIMMVTNPELDKEIIKYREATTHEERVKLAHKIQEMIHEEGTFIPTWMVPFNRFTAWAYIRWPENPPKHAEQLMDVMGLGILWIDPQYKDKIKKDEKLPSEVIKDERNRLDK